MGLKKASNGATMTRITAIAQFVNYFVMQTKIVGLWNVVTHMATAPGGQMGSACCRTRLKCVQAFQKGLARKVWIG